MYGITIASFIYRLDIKSLTFMGGGEAMADLTLNEYRDIPDEELKRILRCEARIIHGSDPIQDGTRKVATSFHLTSFAAGYWTRFIDFISSRHIPLRGRL